MSSLLRFSRRCRCLSYGWIATVATALPYADDTILRFASTNGASNTTFQLVKALASQIQEPGSLNAKRTSTDKTSSSESLSKISSERRQSELAIELCEQYLNLPSLELPPSETCERTKILKFLASECSPTDMTVIKASEKFHKTSKTESNISSRLHSVNLSKLREAATPRHEEILEYILKQNTMNGMGLLVSLREDLLRVMHWMKLNSNDDGMVPHLKNLDAYLMRLFSIWFSPGMLGK